MQRLCLMLCGLLTSCLCVWASNHYLNVTQSPSTVLVKTVEQVMITCSWNKSFTQAKVKWFKDNQKVITNQSNKFIETTYNNASVQLVIKNTDENDAGVYVCEVTQDIPQLQKVNGTGTKIIYERKHGAENGTCTAMPDTTLVMKMAAETYVPTLGAVVSAAAVLILLFCVSLSVWRMKRGCKQSERTVIREGPPSEGDEPENSEDGESSRNSRGSTQWYMVPVYESYFDLQRSDEQQGADADPCAVKAACASALK